VTSATRGTSLPGDWVTCSLAHPPHTLESDRAQPVRQPGSLAKRQLQAQLLTVGALQRRHVVSVEGVDRLRDPVVEAEVAGVREQVEYRVRRVGERGECDPVSPLHSGR